MFGSKCTSAWLQSSGTWPLDSLPQILAIAWVSLVPSKRNPFLWSHPSVLENSLGPGWIPSDTWQGFSREPRPWAQLQRLLDSSLTLGEPHTRTYLGSDQEAALKPGQTVPVLLSVVIHQAVTAHLLSEDPSVWAKGGNVVSSVLVWSFILVCSFITPSSLLLLLLD